MITKRWTVLWGLLALLASTQSVQATEKVTLYLTDALGSPVAEMDASGNVTYQADYRPYGQQQMGAAQDGPGYTGHVNDPDTGLVYMQARYYDPVVGRFISTDPVGPSAGDPFNFNRFAYANNSPIDNIDPDGRCTGSHIHDSAGNCASSGTTLAGPGYGSVKLSSGSGGSGGTSNGGVAHVTAGNYAGNSKLAHEAESAANNSLQTYAGKSFATMDQASVAWSLKVQPITDSLQVEIGSKLFLVGTRFQFGPAVSDGAFATVNINDAPGVRDGVLYGYVHTHPINIGFSPNDLWVVSRWRDTQGLLNPFTAYVSLPNGEVWKWSTEKMNVSPQATWQGYINQATKVTK